MSKSTSADSGRHPYLRKGFFLKQENQFWLNSPDEQYKEKMNKLVESFYHKNSLMLDLIKTK